MNMNWYTLLGYVQQMVAEMNELDKENAKRKAQQALLNARK